MPIVRTHVFITGMVQGVFFRANTRKQALDRGVRGWVRNLVDGRVETIFEGEEADVAALIKWCYVGPPGASVEHVNVRWEEPTGRETSFRIAY